MGAKEKPNKPAASGRKREKEKKNITIILAIVLIGLFAFKGFLMLRGDRKTDAVSQNTMSNLVVSNARAGLTIMGMALKDYKKAKGTYPAGLKDLYPEFVKEKQSVDYSGWLYTTEGKDYFRLERVEARDGIKYLYRIDPGNDVIRTVMGESKEKVLALKHGLKLPSKGTPALYAKTDGEVSTDGVDISATARALREARQREQKMESEKPLVRQEDEQQMAKEESFEPVAPKGHWATVKDEASIPGDISSLTHALSVSSFLIWMNKQKGLCFSNVQYPQADKIEAICARESWLSPGASAAGSKAN